MTHWWKTRTAGQRLVFGVLALIVAFNVVLAALGSILDSGPGGPAASPRGTSGPGLAAYSDLLRSAGHQVTVNTDDLTPADLPVGATAVVADPIRFSSEDVTALTGFLEAGGRLVVIGPDTAEILAVYSGAQTAAAQGGTNAPVTVWVPSGLTGSATEVVGGIGWYWKDLGTLVPLAGSLDNPALVTMSVGKGTLVGLAEVAPLTNRNLARRDNAALGLALAGEGRPVVFVDRTTAPSNSGLSAVPTPWKWTAAALAVALIGFIWSAGSRFGPPEPQIANLGPARREHVEAVAAGMARQQPTPAESVSSLRAAARTALARDLGLAPDASAAVLYATAKEHGIDQTEVDEIIQTPEDLDRALAVGRRSALRVREQAKFSQSGGSQ